jgi:hypothetical protein
MFLIVASILDVKRATQNSHVGATGIGSSFGNQKYGGFETEVQEDMLLGTRGK